MAAYRQKDFARAATNCGPRKGNGKEVEGSEEAAENTPQGQIRTLPKGWYPPELNGDQRFRKLLLLSRVNASFWLACLHF